MTLTDIKNIDLSKHTVLAVDDIPMNLLLISKILSRININISTAANGREALDFIAKNKPSLVLLDLMMPEIDGYEVLRRIRENPETADIRVIILSALNSGIKDFVLIGNLTLLPQCKEVFPALETLYHIRFHIPKYSQYCTAIGAALDYTINNNK